MNKNFFDQEDEYRDVPEEVSGMSAVDILQEQQPGPVMPRRQPATPPQQSHYEEAFENKGIDEEYDVTEELAEDEDDYSQVLNDASLRLEQGNLYKIIMNHSLFEGMDADPVAIKNVERQIRKFAKEQMEIMLGMRQETSKIERLEIDFPFNEVEVRVLKMVADKASGGASKQSDRYIPEVTRVTEEVPFVPKRMGLNPIVGKKTTPVQKKVSAPVPAKGSALKQTAVAPVVRKKSATPDQVIVDGAVITRDMVDAQFDPNHKPLNKPVHEMTTDELLEHNRQSQKRLQRRVKNPSAMPMPTIEQESMLHMTRIQENSNGSNAVAMIMNAINNQTKK